MTTQPSPHDVVRRELDELDRQLESLRKSMSVEYDELLAWEQRAMTAVGEGRDDLARHPR